MAVSRARFRDLFPAVLAPTAVFGCIGALALIDTVLLRPSTSDADDGWQSLVAVVVFYVLPLATVAAALSLYCLGWILRGAPKWRTAVLVATALLPPLGYLLWHEIYAFNWFDPYSRSIVQDRIAEAAGVAGVSVAIVWVWWRLTTSCSARAG
jgi:hypothetical protein